MLPFLPLSPRRSIPSRGCPKFYASVNRRPRPRSLKRTYLKLLAVPIHYALSNGQITEWEWERRGKGRKGVYRSSRQDFNLKGAPAAAFFLFCCSPHFCLSPFRKPLAHSRSSLGLVRDLCACVKGRSGARAVTRRSP